MINLSKQTFTETEFKLLGYNLNFVPTPKTINKAELARDIKLFNRRIKLRDHFGDQLTGKPIFKSNSTWEPKDTHHTVRTFIEDFTRKAGEELDGPTQQRRASSNLSKAELSALQDLKEMDNIIITKADKGGAVVIQDVGAYIQEANRQLSDANFYRKLSENPTSEHAALVENALDDLKQRNLLDGRTADKLKPVNPNTPKLYLLPKVHKDNNPGRPVVSAVGCHTEKISAFVDHHLQPMTKELPSYVKDTTHLIKKLDALPDIPADTILVTMDVRSLYTNIPNEEGKQAIKDFFRERARPGDEKLSKVINVLLTLILTLNNFIFNGENYIQTNGCSMGTKCAPSYASLYMGWFEKIHILPRIREHTLMYVRFIDDILLVWKGSEEELLKFLNEINKVHPTIKFDFKYSRESVDFLDTTIKETGNRLTTTLYTKPTDRKAYLHAKSYHPGTTKNSIAFSQATRIRRICTTDEDFWIHANKLKHDLTNRGYSESTISREIERAAEIERATLLRYKERPISKRIPLIVEYNKNLPKFKEILEDKWHHLEINPTVKEKFRDKPLICYKRNRNLRDELGQTKITNNKVIRTKPLKRGRCSPCLGRSDCMCCNHIISTNFFTDRAGKRYEIRHRTNCRSKYAIYLGFCIKCNQEQYVGKVEAQGMNRRTNKHRNDVTRPDSIAIDRHFNQKDHDFNRDFRVIVIEEITKKNLTKDQMRDLLLHREDFWINKLKTLEPNGFNEKLNFPETL